MLCLDVDGVLTDGKLYWAGEGLWSQRFCVRDGYGIKLLQEPGVEIADPLGRRRALGPRSLRRRSASSTRYFGVVDKVAAFRDVAGALGLGADEAAFIGDELVDVPLLVAGRLLRDVPDAVDEVQRGRRTT